MKRRFKILPSDVVKSLVEFLDEVQFDAAKHEDDKDAMHKINFCNWAIQELLNSHDGIVKGFVKGKDDKPKPQSKSRDQYIDETFMDWNLPEMNDKDYEKLVDNFDNFLRSWEKEYYKDHPKKKSKKRKPKEPRFEDIVQHCSLDEIRDMLLDDPELTPNERFDLYYEEHKRVEKEKIPKYTLNQIMKKAGIDPPPKNK